MSCRTNRSIRSLGTFALLAAVLLTTLLCGCGPKLTPQDLGTVVRDPMELPGFGQSYSMPRMRRKIIKPSPMGPPDTQSVPDPVSDE